jgi:hypothetical protein
MTAGGVAATGTIVVDPPVGPIGPAGQASDAVPPPRQPRPAPPCKHWARAGSCLYHSRGLCRFGHPEKACGGGGTAAAAAAGGGEGDDATNGNGDNNYNCSGRGNHSTTRQHRIDSPSRHRSVGGRLRVRNDARAAIFRSFVAAEWQRAHQEKGGHPHSQRHQQQQQQQQQRDGSHQLDRKDDDGDGDKDRPTPPPPPPPPPPPHHPLSSARVLDVAGGKGEIAFQFLNLCNVESCHVVDPRPLSLRRFQHRLERGFYHRSQRALHPEIVTEWQDASLRPRPVGHLRCFFTDELWPHPDPRPSTPSSCEREGPEEKDDAGLTTKQHLSPDPTSPHQDEDDEDGNGNGDDKNGDPRIAKFQSNQRATEEWTWPPKPNLTHNPNKMNSKGRNPSREDDDDHHCRCHGCDWDDAKDGGGDDDSNGAVMCAPLPTLEEAAAVVGNATLIVGMHPDQAVDAIVDAALAMNISFFVVPCCTYSQEFPHRRYQGRPVTKYEDLLGYLQAKAPPGTIRRAVLAFEGKNVCLYRVVVVD